MDRGCQSPTNSSRAPSPLNAREVGRVQPSRFHFKSYDAADFVNELRGMRVTAHVAQKTIVFFTFEGSDEDNEISGLGGAPKGAWREQQTEAAGGDPLVAALQRLVEHSAGNTWEGTTADLLSVVASPFGGSGKLNIRSPQRLGQDLARLDARALSTLGPDVGRRRVNGRLLITLKRTGERAAQGSPYPF